MEDRLKKLEDRIEQLEERNDELEDRVDELEDKLEDHKTISGKNRAEIRGKLSEVADGISGESDSGGIDRSISWMERYHNHGTSVLDDRPRARDIHAKVLFAKLPDWATLVNGHIVLKTSTGVRAKMRRALGSESFEYSELYRACKALEERTDHQVQYHEDHKKLGRCLIISNEVAKKIQLDLSGVTQWSNRGPEAKQSVLAMT